jgi:hypothetical protein
MTMLLSTLLLVLAADPKVSGDANITMKLDGKNEYAAGVHALVPIIPALAVTVDVSSRTATDAPVATTVGGVSLIARNWSVGVSMRSQPEGPLQPCVNARAILVQGPSTVIAQVKVTPSDAKEKVTAGVGWASTRSPVAVNVVASTRGSVSVGVSVSTL